MWGAEALDAPSGTNRSSASSAPACSPTSSSSTRTRSQNLKVLYGTGWLRVNDTTGAVERVGGVKYVIKDGIVYDAKKLLADVEKMVAEAKKK